MRRRERVLVIDFPVGTLAMVIRRPVPACKPGLNIDRFASVRRRRWFRLGGSWRRRFRWRWRDGWRRRNVLAAGRLFVPTSGKQDEHDGYADDP